MTTVAEKFYGLSSSFRQSLVEGVRIKDIAPRWPNVVYAQTNETVADVFKKLIDCSILSVPLLDVDTQKYIAFIDVFDILAYVVDVLNLPIDKDESWMASSQFQNSSCIVLPNKSKKNPWYIINENDPIQSAINALSQNNIHRIAVVDSAGRFSSVITQSRIIRFLSNRSLELGELGMQTIEQLNISSPLEVVARGEDRLLDAFMRMHNYGVSGVPILNSYGKVIGNVSISDIKDIGFSAQMFRKLFVSTEQFLDTKVEGQNLPRLIWAYNTSYFSDVLFKLRANGVHRVYVVKSFDMICNGVITLTDILKLFSTF